MSEMKKNILWNVIGTTCNAFNSLFFMIIVTRINGISDSGIFTMAFSLACLFCLFAGYEGRVYQVTDIRGDFSDSEYIVHRYITSVAAMLIVFGYSLFMRYDSSRFWITGALCFMKIMEMLADVYYGILQKNDQLHVVGKSLTVKALLSLIVFILCDLITHNLVIACLSLDLIWIAVLAVYDIPSAGKYVKHSSPKWRNVMRLFRSGFFAFAILFLAIYLVNAPKYALDGRVSSSLQAVFGIVLMPATFLSLAVQYVIQPILNRLARCFSFGRKAEFNSLIAKVIAGMFVFGILVLAAAYVLGIPVLNILYGIDISPYRIHLMIIIAGAVLYSVSTLLSAALTTVRYTFIQFVVFSISSVFGFVISGMLIEKYSILGASEAYFAIMLCQLVLYLIAYAAVMRRITFTVSE